NAPEAPASETKAPEPAPEPAAATAIAAAPSPVSAPPAASRVATDEAAPAATAGLVPRATQDIVGLARRGAHTEALMAAEAAGFATTCDALSGPDLLILADASRYAGRFERANEALRAARRRFAGSDSAAVAAFELGRIAMDITSDLGVAGDHFEDYL